MSCCSDSWLSGSHKIILSSLLECDSNRSTSREMSREMSLYNDQVHTQFLRGKHCVVSSGRKWGYVKSPNQDLILVEILRLAETTCQVSIHDHDPDHDAVNTRSEWRPVVLWSIESEMYFADYSVLFSLSRFHMLSSMFE